MTKTLFLDQSIKELMQKGFYLLIYWIAQNPKFALMYFTLQKNNSGHSTVDIKKLEQEHFIKLGFTE